jgi:hypothetical protein
MNKFHFVESKGGRSRNLPKRLMNMHSSLVMLVCVSLFFALLMTFSSCQTLGKIYFGVKDPTNIIESTEVSKYAFDLGMDTTLLTFTNDPDSSWIRLVKLLELPSVLVFDRSGNYLPYKPDSISCNAGSDIFLLQLNTDRNYDKDPFLKEERIWKDLRPHPNFALKSDFDFTVYITWAKFAGKKSYEQSCKTWLQAVKDNTRAKIQVFVVDLDRVK